MEKRGVIDVEIRRTRGVAELFSNQEGAMTSKLLYTRKEAAQVLSVSLRFLDGLIGRRELRPRRIGRRVLVEHRELERFARADHVFPNDRSSSARSPQYPLTGVSEMPQDAPQCRTEG